VLATEHRRAFSVRFADLRVWNVNSFVDLGWNWPAETIKPLSAALQRRREERLSGDDAAPRLLTLHFDGSIEPRRLRTGEPVRGKLYLAYPGDVLYSKIDARHGAIGIIPSNLGVATVTAEYPVYRVREEVALPEYIKLLLRTRHFRRVINGMISGASGRKRVQPKQVEGLHVPLPQPPFPSVGCHPHTLSGT